MTEMISSTTHVDNSIVAAANVYEHSPSYEVLVTANLLCNKFRLKDESEIDCVPANSSRTLNMAMGLLPCGCCCISKGFVVPSGFLALVEDGRGNFLFYGEGVHLITDPFFKVKAEHQRISSSIMLHGDRALVTVEQGYIGYAVDKGQPILLPPGIHQWKSQTMLFERVIDLNDHVIRLGPYTLITIDEGYAAVTQNNGQQKILPGGHVYLLTHRNWKFEKFVSMKIQTNILEKIEAPSADNVLMTVAATINWRISDVDTAVRMSAETMNSDGSNVMGDDIKKLRYDVLKQAEASLSSYIGTVNYSGTFAMQSAHFSKKDAALSSIENNFSGDYGAEEKFDDKENDDSIPIPIAKPTSESKNVLVAESIGLFDPEKLSNAIDHANQITLSYGVTVMSINIISAVPKDMDLMRSLAKGAVAAAEAQQMETAAKGKAKATQIEASARATADVIEAEGKSRALKITAKAEADAVVTRAEGALTGARKLEQSDVAIDLARIEKTGDAIQNKSSFFFGANSADMGHLLANPNVIKLQK